MRAAAGIVFLLLASGLMLDRFYSDASILPPDDFLQYWAAGRLNATGGNPYDADALLELQRGAGRPADKPAVMMWNPPWVLTLATPFGLLPPRTAQLLWLACQIAIVIFAADRFWSRLGGDSRHRPWVWIGSLAFFPLMYIVFAGQSSGWLLLGLAGLVCGSNWRFALLLPVLAVKPHLFVPIWIALVLEAGRTRRGALTLAVGAGTGLVVAALPTIANPDVWRQYIEAMNRPVDAAHSPLSGWRAPLVGWWVRMAVSPESFWIQAVPTALIALATPIYWWRRRQSWDWLVEAPRLVLAGFICSPYGAWPYDQIALLLPVLAGFAAVLQRGSREQLILASISIGIVNGVALVIREGEHFVWVPPAIALWFAWASAATVPTRCQSERPEPAGALA